MVCCDGDRVGEIRYGCWRRSVQGRTVAKFSVRISTPAIRCVVKTQRAGNFRGDRRDGVLIGHSHRCQGACRGSVAQVRAAPARDRAVR